MKVKKSVSHNQLDEVNLLFEIIKTILITGLSYTKVKKLLNEYTHLEIRNGQKIGSKFVISDIVMHDLEFLRQKSKKLSPMILSSI